MTKILTQRVDLTPGIDDGYSAICLGCKERKNPFPYLVGKPRTLDVIICPPCVIRLEKEKEEKAVKDRERERNENRRLLMKRMARRLHEL